MLSLYSLINTELKMELFDVYEEAKRLTVMSEGYL